MTTTQTQSQKDRALGLLRDSIEHGVLISRDNRVAVIYSENGEENWRWMSIDAAAEDIVRQNAFEILEKGIKKAKVTQLIEQCFEEGILWEEEGKIFSPWFHFVEGESVEWSSRETLLVDLLSQGTWLSSTKYNPRSEAYLRAWHETFAKTKESFPELHEMLFSDRDTTLVFSEEPGYHYAYYFNPDSNAGGQIVECPFDDGMARRIRKGENFIDVVAERTQYLSDINTSFFFDTVNDLIESKEEMYIGCVQSEENWKSVLREVA